MPIVNHEQSAAAGIRVEQVDRQIRIVLSGRLDTDSVEAVWKPALDVLRRHPVAPIRVDAQAVVHADGAGIALLLDLLRQPRPTEGRVQIEGLQPRYQALLDQFDPEHFRPVAPRAIPREPLTERLGRGGSRFAHSVLDALAFIGDTASALLASLARARSVRWQDVFQIAQRVGADALPIVSLIAFLIGLILAFQAAIALRQFGAQVFVANLVGLSLLRELGPLMTAILLAGRTGAAFAAEIGTMRVNEEVDALVTMGLDPVRFLVVPRLLAALVMTPLLTLYADLIGLLGGAMVMLTYEIPYAAYMRQTFSFVTASDFLGGMAKSFVFGSIVAIVGCFRGLQTKSGPAAVGESTTRAVVTSLVLIVVADGAFAVAYYYLDI
jgi:phospholipid/cholesterol/gamma-HCH transport system permease protein